MADFKGELERSEWEKNFTGEVFEVLIDGEQLELTLTNIQDDLTLPLELEKVLSDQVKDAIIGDTIQSIFSDYSIDLSIIPQDTNLVDFTVRDYLVVRFQAAIDALSDIEMSALVEDTKGRYKSNEG